MRRMHRDGSRHRLRATLAAAIGGAGLVWGAAAYSAEVLVDGIAAQVGTEVVLISEVNRIAAPMEARMRSAGAPPGEIDKMKADVLENLIENRILDIVAQRAEVVAEHDEIDNAIRAIARENGISIDTLRQSVEAQGLSFDVYQDKIAQEIVRQKILSGMVRPHVEIDEAKVRELYEERFGDQPDSGNEIHVYHLMVPAIEQKTWAIELACEEASGQRKRIVDGEDFLTVARETTPGSPDLGWLYQQDLASWMVDAVTTMQNGQISEPIKLPVGCSVLQVIDRREVRPMTFEEARPRLEAELFQTAFDRESQAFFDRMREKTYIERKDVFAETERLSFSPTKAESDLQ